jgi:hypothetical protein
VNLEASDHSFTRRLIEIAAARGSGTSPTAALHAMRLPAIALDRHGFVAGVNAAAEAIFDNDFRIKDRRLFVRDPDARARLNDAIDQLKTSPRPLRERVRSVVQQIRIGEAQILVWLNRTAIVSSVMPDAPPKPTDSVESFVLSITASLRRAGKGVRLVIGNGAAKAIDDGLASLIARAIATRNMFLAGRDDSIDAMASRLGVRRDYVAVLVRLSYLSPEIVRAILVGQQPVELTPIRLVMHSRNLPHDWQEQRRLLGFAPA